MFRESLTNEEVNNLPIIGYQGEIIVLETGDQKVAERYLSKQKLIGFDTESRANFTKGTKDSISLVQLSGAEKAFLIRLNKTGLSPGIIKILQSRKIVKVGLAIHDDLKKIMEVYDKFFPHNFVDLQSIVKDYGIQELGLKKISGIVLGKRISKAQRLSNWNAVKLTEAQQRYAATDAWICREIYMKLLNSVKTDVKRSENISQER